MDKRMIRVKRLETTKPNHVVDVDVMYFGHNRGYYVNVQPKEIDPPKTPGGFYGEKFMMFSGKSAKIEDAARFNRRRLEELASLGEKVPHYEETLKQVCEEQEITLAPAASGNLVALVGEQEKAPRGWEAMDTSVA